MPMLSETPFCLSLHVCDVAYRDAASGKWSILGSYERIRFRSIPARVPLVMYFAITDGRGTMPLRTQVIHASAEFDDAAAEDTLAGFVDGDVTLSDPMHVVHGVTKIPCTFSGAGVYNCELWVNDVRLMYRRLVVVGPGEG